MTDITELAQSLKAAAVRAQDATGEYASQRISSTAFRLEIEEFESLAHKPANILALLEALEKAQAGEKQWREVADAFCADDADWHKLTNSNNELIALLSQALCKQADRIAELESRTVTVKLPDFMPPEAAPAHYWGSGESMAYADGYNKSAADLKTSFAQSCSSAGVNVEFE